MRVAPQVGARATVLHLGHEEGATIVAVDGPVVEVETDAGEALRFELHPLTGHFVLAGGPYWGTRLRLARDKRHRGVS